MVNSTFFEAYLNKLAESHPPLLAVLERERRYAAMTDTERFIDAMRSIAALPSQVALREENARRRLRAAHKRGIYSGPLARRFVEQTRADLREEWEEEHRYDGYDDWR